MILSVALCTYNGEKYISKQLDSILSQYQRVHEIIIVDDCSSDGTIEILKKYASLNTEIKLYQNEATLGYLNNFEKAINLCSGDIIFLSDQDDIWFQEKTEKLCDIFKLNVRVNCVVSDLQLINAEETLLNKTFFETIFKDAPLCKTKADIIQFLINKGNFAVGAGIAFKKREVSFKHNVSFVHDAQLIIDALKDDSLYVDENSYTGYRIHNTQSIGLRHASVEKNSDMLEAYERYKRAEYIYNILGNEGDALDTLKSEFLIKKQEYLQKFGCLNRFLRKLKWYISPPFHIS